MKNVSRLLLVANIGKRQLISYLFIFIDISVIIRNDEKSYKNLTNFCKTRDYFVITNGLNDRLKCLDQSL